MEVRILLETPGNKCPKGITFLLVKRHVFRIDDICHSMSTKKCTQCGIEKEFSEFSPKGNGKYASRCKICIAANKRVKYVRHPGATRPPVLEGDTKRCRICLEVKDISEFYSNNGCGTHRNECKSCLIDKRKKKYDQTRQILWNYLKEHPCVDCSEDDPLVLEFDHISNKFQEISDLIRNGYNVETIFKEIEKCEVRCANCHRRKTAIQLNWYIDVQK